MSADLDADLARQRANHARLVSEAAALGVSPQARDRWELVHEAAGIVAKIESRQAQEAWTA